jgi:hypothetical protein
MIDMESTLFITHHSLFKVDSTSDVFMALFGGCTDVDESIFLQHAVKRYLNDRLHSSCRAGLY